ncbi:hypothetical protein QAD02_010770 [Eretmocerus hayati]|uniref:Uncharacterized protein n=1 Tax=Eretmocerus hayati TaxID=131215 RepID=A0ACC2NV53_9HYME|nr:hypothetical protein QAD02_010770 [Eretmocerus hayati]
MAYKFACNLSFMFQEVPVFTDRYQKAKDAGFKAVESGFPLGFSVQQVVEAKKKAGIEQALINVYTGDTLKGELGFAAIPGKEKEFESSIDLTIEYAKALDCKKIHVMAGRVENPTAANDAAYEKSLRHAATKFASEGIIGVIEPINNITVPNYYMNNFEKAVEILKKIQSPHLKLQVDFFHLQLSRGAITKTFEECFPYVGHIQIAQVPDRNEPHYVGEIDYRYVFSLLEKHKYNGYIGLEYKPKAGTVDGLVWLQQFGFTL